MKGGIGVPIWGSLPDGVFAKLWTSSVAPFSALTPPCIYNWSFTLRLVELSLNRLYCKQSGGGHCKSYAVTIWGSSVKTQEGFPWWENSGDSSFPPLPLVPHDYRVLWVRELHIWTLQHGNWLNQSIHFWHCTQKNSEVYPLFHPRTWLGQVTLVIEVNLTIWHQATWCSGSRNCTFGRQHGNWLFLPEPKRHGRKALHLPHLVWSDYIFRW